MDQYYVYAYIDDSGDMVYIGHGCKGRAWHVGYMRGDTFERHEWKEEQIKKNRLPCDYVIILDRGLKKPVACAIEQKLIKEHRPLFNKLGNPDAYTAPTWLQQALNLYSNGLSYKEVARTLDSVSTMTVWRHINRAT